MQFKVPQDVQRPDTIVGPLTMRQLVICIIGGAIAYSLFLTLSKQYFLEIWLPPVLFIAAVTLVFAFFRFHNLPFERVALFFIEYKFKPQKRFFQKMMGDVFLAQPLEKPTSDKAALTKEQLDQEKLKKLAELTKKLNIHSTK